MLIYNFPDNVNGDYWPGVSSIVYNVDGIPVDLTDAQVDMQLKPRPDADPTLSFSTLDGSITITTPASTGEIMIKGRVIDITPQTYFYDIKYHIPSIAPTFVKTPLGGKLNVMADITTVQY